MTRWRDCRAIDLYRVGNGETRCRNCDYVDVDELKYEQRQMMWAGRGSNPRISDYESGPLTTEVPAP